MLSSRTQQLLVHVPEHLVTGTRKELATHKQEPEKSVTGRKSKLVPRVRYMHLQYTYRTRSNRIVIETRTCSGQTHNLEKPLHM